MLDHCTLRLHVVQHSISLYPLQTRGWHNDWYQDGILFICSQTRRRPVRRGKKSLRKAMQNHPDYPVPALSAPSCSWKSNRVEIVSSGNHRVTVAPPLLRSWNSWIHLAVLGSVSHVLLRKDFVGRSIVRSWYEQQRMLRACDREAKVSRTLTKPMSADFSRKH